MMASNIYITPSTSLVLIKGFTRPTNIFLSTFNVPDFQVNVRDITGSSTLQVTLSTIGGAKFLNNTTSYTINQPYGFVNMSLRTSTLWQILHTSGQTPTQSAANVGTTRLSTLYTGVLSTATKQVSSMTLENLTTPNSIQLVGPFIIGNLSTPGFIQFQSTLNVYGNVSFEKNLFVSGVTSTLSSFSVETLLPLSSGIQTFSSLGIGSNINVGRSVFLTSTLHTQSTLQVDTLQVQKSSPDTTVFVTDSVLAAGLVSTLRDVSVGGQLQLGGNITVTQEVSSFTGTFSTGTLTVGGQLLLMNSLSSLSTASFASSLTLQSSLYIQTSFSSFSTVNIGAIVSTTAFVTNLLSSSTSFSTAGDFSVLSTLTVKGTLSTNFLTVQRLFSTGLTLSTGGTVSTLGFTQTGSLVVQESAVLSSLTVSSSVGIGRDIFVKGSTSVNSFLLNGDLTVGNTIQTVGQAFFGENLGFVTMMRVRGNMSVVGATEIPNYDVGSYQVSSLQIITSSPYIALRTSSFVADILLADQAQLVYNPLSGSINPRAYTDIQANSIYAKEVEAYRFSSQTVFVENLLTTPSRISSTSFPRFEVDQKAIFGLGLSTTYLNSETIEANTFLGSFIGDGGNLALVPLYFSTVSAATVLVSTITTNLFSTKQVEVFNAVISNVGEIGLELSLNTPFLFVSSLYMSSMQTMMIESRSQSTLNIANTLYIESSTQKVGVGISSPYYDFDIRGSLYYSGTLSFSTTNTLNFSTTKPVISFSSIWFSSIIVKEDAILPSATLLPTSSFYSFVSQANNPQFVLSERIMPDSVTSLVTYSNTFRNGIYTNSNFSTIDLDLQVIAYNNTKQVGIRTLTFDTQTSQFYPSPISPNYDLFVNGELKTSTLLTSSLTAMKITISSLITPTFGLNPFLPSTLNTFSTSFAKSSYNSKITMNTFVDLIKDGNTLQGYMQIKRPYDGLFDNQYYFSVYGDAYISSVTIPKLCADTLYIQSQLL
jgi:hypothetical protein